MSSLGSKRVNPSKFTISLRRHPFTHFGLPFLSLIVLSSFALTSFTTTRYDLRDQKVQSVNKEEELRMRKDRRKINARDEYYRMQALDQLGESDSYENKRVERLPGQAEWGELPVARKGP
ncbi:Cytochrome oxidase assembly [Rhodotorula toruloides]